jgi:hypothetical protein
LERESLSETENAEYPWRRIFRWGPFVSSERANVRELW